MFHNTLGRILSKVTPEIQTRSYSLQSFGAYRASHRCLKSESEKEILVFRFLVLENGVYESKRNIGAYYKENAFDFVFDEYGKFTLNFRSGIGGSFCDVLWTTDDAFSNESTEDIFGIRKTIETAIEKIREYDPVFSFVSMDISRVFRNILFDSNMIR